MKILKLFLLSIIIFISFGYKNNGIIRKLDDDNSDNFDEIDTDNKDNIDNSDNEFITDITDIETSSLSESSMNNTDIQKPKLILVGFSGFSKIEKYISFYVFFKRIFGHIYPEFLYVILHINYIQNLRNLQEIEELVQCPIISNKTDNLLKFNCSHFTKSDNFSYISVDKNISLDNITNDNISIHFSSYANKTINNLQEQINNIFENGVVTLNHAEIIEQNEFEQLFEIQGNILDDFNEKNVYFLLNEDDNENDNVKNVSCDIYKENNNSYILNCPIKHSIMAHLDGVIGETSSKPLMISMNEKSNDLVNMKVYNSFGYRKKIEKGLPSGAIAAIVISCVVALIVVGIMIVMFRKPKKHIVQPSELNMFTSSTIVAQK